MRRMQCDGRYFFEEPGFADQRKPAPIATSKRVSLVENFLARVCTTSTLASPSGSGTPRKEG